MVTFAQAQERAEEWINGDVPGYQHREVRVREFELGFVVWAEDRAEGPRSDGGAQRLVIARDSGEASLWPSLPVGEVIRRYEEEYGLPDAAPDPAPAPPARVDLNQTSFLLTPPEWLQEAADRMGIPDRRDRTSGGASGAASGGSSGGASGGGSSRPSDGTPDRTPDRASDGAGSRPAAAAAASVNDAVPPGGSAVPRMVGPGAEGRFPRRCPGPGVVRGRPPLRVAARRGPPPAGRPRVVPGCPPTRRRGPGPTPTPSRTTTVRCRCPRPCTRRR